MDQDAARPEEVGATDAQAAGDKSPEMQSEIWGEARPPPKPKNRPAVLEMPVIPTGASYAADGKTYSISNTCNVDTTLQILYFLYTYNPVGRMFLQARLNKCPFSTVVGKVLSCIENYDFGQARFIWITSVIGQNLDENSSIYGSESRNGTSLLAPWTKVIERKRCCLNAGCRRMTQKLVTCTDIIGFSPANILSKLNKGEVMEQWCNKFKADCNITYSVKAAPDVLVYTCTGRVTENHTTTNIARERSLALRQKVFGTDYEVAAYTLYTGNHYAVVLADGKKFVVNVAESKVPP